MNRKTSLARNKENIRPSYNMNFKNPIQQNIIKKQPNNLLKSHIGIFPRDDFILQDQQTNPQLCQPNIENIFEYLADKTPSHKIKSDYMASQVDINERMRSILIDWLVDVNVKFKLLPQTLFQTVNLIDRYLSQRQVQRQHLQLVGVSALMIIGKYEEIYPPVLKDYIAVCDNAYSRQQILDMEADILLQMNFDLTQATSFSFLELIQQKVQLQDKAFVFARYILENSLLDCSSLKYSNLELASGAIFLINKIFKNNQWNLNFLERYQVSLKTIKSCAKNLFQILQQIDSKQLTALKRKFSSIQFYEVSKYKIEKIKKHQLIYFIKFRVFLKLIFLCSNILMKFTNVFEIQKTSQRSKIIIQKIDICLFKFLKLKLHKILYFCVFEFRYFYTIKKS